jgi:hypothetical protein
VQQFKAKLYAQTVTVHIDHIMTSMITVEPFSFPEQSDINFGAVASNADVENLAGKKHST